MGTLYVHAAVGRAGLGNMLVPWAWAELFRREHSAPMLAPLWMRARVGTILRRERDKRFYVGLFRNSGYVRGPRRLWVLARARRITPEDHARGSVPGGRRPIVVVFRFTDAGLRGLGPHRQFLAARLQEILARPVKRRLAAAPASPQIGVHIRRGDRPPLKYGQPFGDDWMPGMPDEWFVGAIKGVREAAGWPAPVTLFTDAGPGQLDRILSLENVRLAPTNPSVVDILLLARSRVLIATGSSSFSAWASFLGRMPTLYYPGLLERLRADWTLGLGTDLDGQMEERGRELVRTALAERA